MNEKFMNLAIKEAYKAKKKDEVPVGAIIVEDDKVLAKAHNLVEKRKNPLQHAEIIVINKACKKKNNWRLNNCELYITLEPCDMCKKIIEAARIKKVYYILNKNKESKKEKTKYYKTNFEENEYLNLIQDFFKEKR